MKKFSFVMLLTALILSIYPVVASAWDRSTPSVAPDSPYYRDLDKLVAFRLVDPPIRGQRPYPRSEFARMTAEARGNLEKQAGEKKSFTEIVRMRDKRWQIEASLRRLEKEFKDELIDMGDVAGGYKTFRIDAVDDLTIEQRYLDSPPTQIPPNNGRGPINAYVNPMGDYNLGRHAVYGYTGAVEAEMKFNATKFVSGLVRPRLEFDVYKKQPDEAHAYLQDGYVTFKAGNFSMKAGRDSMVWGMGDDGSLLFSTNPRPLDGLWLTNPTPARLPWVFKYLGKWRYTLYATNLGPEQTNKWPFLTGYKISLAPVKYLELGFGHAVMIGGEGMPAPNFADVIGEFIGFRIAGTDPSSPNLSNHTFEGELLLRVPELRGVELYGNFAVEDKWKSVTKTIKHGMAFMGGLYLPRIDDGGTADFRAEYVHTSPLQYRHGLYVEGFTLNGKLIGSDAGPDADTIGARFRQSLSENFLYEISLGLDYRRSATYTELANPDGTAGPVIKLSDGPTERRMRGVVGARYGGMSLFNITGSFGYERVDSYNFTQGYDRNNFLVAASLSIDLERFFDFAGN